MTESKDGSTNRWDTATYDEDHSFVFEYSEDVVERLEPEDGERILALGCGTGYRSARIAESGADVIGLYVSKGMIEKARETHPGCEFVRADARAFSVEEPFDAVFSNAALYWLSDQDAALEAISDAPTPGGRFVGEIVL